MWNPWRKRPEENADMSTGDEAKQALARAHASKTEAVSHLTEAREKNAEIRREIIVNHLARDIYESMRRRA